LPHAANPGIVPRMSDQSNKPPLQVRIVPVTPLQQNCSLA
jgi:hypothetical protein